MSQPKNAWMKGRRARVKYGITTRGGTEFPKGMVCRVSYVDRGKLALSAPNPDEMNIFGPRHIFVRCVRAWEVEILPLPSNKLCPCPHSPGAHSTCGCLVRDCQCKWKPGDPKTAPAQPVEAEPDDEDELKAADERYDKMVASHLPLTVPDQDLE